MSKNVSGGGMGLLGVLQVIFIVLKLIGTISWPWVKVLLPLWINLGIWLIGFLVLTVYWTYSAIKYKW